MITNYNGVKRSMYNGLEIIQSSNEGFEIKGYSSDSGTFFQSVNTENINDVKKVIDLSNDRKNDNKVKQVFPKDYYDIHKRICYFSVNFNIY